MGTGSVRVDDAVTLESDVLDTDLVVFLSIGYVVTVWEKDGMVFYRLTQKPGPQQDVQQ